MNDRIPERETIIDEVKVDVPKALAKKGAHRESGAARLLHDLLQEYADDTTPSQTIALWFKFDE